MHLLQISGSPITDVEAIEIIQPSPDGTVSRYPRLKSSQRAPPPNAVHRSES